MLMEAEENIESWRCETNWNIAHGSLRNTISVESCVNSVKPEEDFVECPVDFLLLESPSSTTSCEITVSFKQCHEIRRIYVRSTARIYEIYTKSGRHGSDSEYMGTVRCGIVENDRLVQENNSVDTRCEERDNNTGRKTSLMLKGKSDSNYMNNEDGWVEVKVPDSPPTHKSTQLLNKTNNSNGIKSQVFHEATADITDQGPCISLSLRLLSLENKGHVHIEEICIYADPFDLPVNLERQSSLENPGESSMLAMLFPTLLQLSKTGLIRKEDRHVSSIRDKKFSDDNGPLLTESNISGCEKIKQKDVHTKIEDSFTMAVQERANAQKEETQSSTHQTSYKDESLNNIVSLLNQLLHRVDRIEAFCSRFEENMLNPIDRIESKLQQLENQLESLVLRSTSSPCSNPENANLEPKVINCDFIHPCNADVEPLSHTYKSQIKKEVSERQTPSLDDELFFSDFKPLSHTYKSQKENEVSERESPFPDDGLVFSELESEAASSSVGNNNVLPEFSNDNDSKAVDENSELGIGNFSGKKPSITIDDALASALKAFSLTSIQPIESSPALIATSPKISCGDDDKDLNSCCSEFLLGKVVNPETELQEVPETEIENYLDLPPCFSSINFSAGDFQQKKDENSNNKSTSLLDDDSICIGNANGFLEEQDEESNVWIQYARNHWQDDKDNIQTTSETLIFNQVDAEISTCKDTEVYIDTILSSSIKDLTNCDENELNCGSSKFLNFEFPVLDLNYLPRESDDIALQLKVLPSDMPKSESSEIMNDDTKGEKTSLIDFSDASANLMLSKDNECAMDLNYFPQESDDIALQLKVLPSDMPKSESFEIMNDDTKGEKTSLIDFINASAELMLSKDNEYAEVHSTSPFDCRQLESFPNLI